MAPAPNAACPCRGARAWPPRRWPSTRSSGRRRRGRANARPVSVAVVIAAIVPLATKENVGGGMSASGVPGGTVAGVHRPLWRALPAIMSSVPSPSRSATRERRRRRWRRPRARRARRCRRGCGRRWWRARAGDHDVELAVAVEVADGDRADRAGVDRAASVKMPAPSPLASSCRWRRRARGRACRRR